MTLLKRTVTSILMWFFKNPRLFVWLVFLVVVCMFIALAIGKTYQRWDKHPTRGAVAIDKGAFGEDYSTPVYLDQGWDEADSLWFYNTTQGSALIPYDFMLVLEQDSSQELVRSNNNMDGFRYLPQQPSFFNPDGLPVGFVKETYQGNDYVGYTCAACHTGQVNYQGKAIRIDGGPAMADMVGFLTHLEKSMQQTLDDSQKQQRFIDNVLALKNDYKTKDHIIKSLQRWTKTVRLYNTVNHSHIDYGYARLDAFGRIYNRVLQHVINKEQLAEAMSLTTTPTGRRVINDAQIAVVLEGIGEDILVDQEFAKVMTRLASNEPGFPGLNQRDQLRIRNAVFNEPNAPVSYPFLWDIAQSDYVQWNGLAGNGNIGPLGRNTGEVVGVFALLEWSAKNPGFSISAYITGQTKKNKRIDFKSSVDLVNLKRLESHLRGLQSPQWPEHILGKIDRDKAERGRHIYAEYCQSCHEVIERDNWDRIVIGKMSSIDSIGTDPAMASNSVNYTGMSGNFKHTLQKTGVGRLVIEERAPVVQILTSAVSGVIATPDPDKTWVRRWLDWLYTLAMSFFQNDIEDTIKSGNYQPDTTAKPYQSLLSYKARSLNGIWATAPYLHNGSVPTMYDLLLPHKRPNDPEEGEYRPESFMVGSREFDPVKMGFRSEGYDGFRMTTFRVGDKNTGHEYGAGRSAQPNGTVLPALDEAQRWDLIEYIKTL